MIDYGQRLILIIYAVRKAMNSTYESVTVHEKCIQANGLRMFYRECGMGAPLILLHSGTAASDEWGR